jgi:hypothetical protein
LAGCAALTNPLVESVPVRRLPPELLGHSKEGEFTIPLTLLGQPRSDAYRVAPGDVLGIWIEGVTGERTVGPPIHIAPQVQSADQRRFPPAAGYPVTVRADGTMVLPQVEPMKVQGLTLEQVEDKIREEYTVKKRILQPGAERLIVTLLQPRHYQVLVFRQEANLFQPNVNGFTITSSKRGTGHVLELPAGENDVAHAVARTGGLPGLDACNEIIIFRSCFRGELERGQVLHQLETSHSASPPLGLDCLSKEVTRIPLRWFKGEPPPFRAEDVVLNDGDVVFIEARDRDVFYTGGLLPSGMFELPRDRDLDVIEAVTMVRGPLLTGGFATSNLSGNLYPPGAGNPSPSLLVVLRRLPGRYQIPIRVDLNRALVDGRERILVQPGDVLLLQEKPGEALARYFSQTMFNYSLTWQVLHERFAQGVVDFSSPQLIPGRIGITNFIP